MRAAKLDSTEVFMSSRACGFMCCHKIVCSNQLGKLFYFYNVHRLRLRGIMQSDGGTDVDTVDTVEIPDC